MLFPLQMWMGYFQGRGIYSAWAAAIFHDRNQFVNDGTLRHREGRNFNRTLKTKRKHLHKGEF